MFVYGGEFYHWTGGWHSSQVNAVLHFMNKIMHPVVHLKDMAQIEEFSKHDFEWTEETDFINSEKPAPLGDIFEHSVLKTRVLVLDQDAKELHDAQVAARHLADRVELRFGFNRDEAVLKEYDDKYHDLKNKKEMKGTYDGLVVINHRDNRVPMHLHFFHNEFQEQSIRDFVTRESFSYLEDLNADTIHTVAHVGRDMPILLCFVDPHLNQRDKVAGRAQAVLIDEVLREFHLEGHSRALALIVAIDDGEFGNSEVRQLFGLHKHTVDTELSYYPHLVVYH